MLPTPRASDANGTKLGAEKQGGLVLNQAVQLFPTPVALDANLPGGKRGLDSLAGQAHKVWATPTTTGNHNHAESSAASGDGLATQVGGLLNPDWVEALMGFPPGWTELPLTPKAKTKRPPKAPATQA